MRATFAWSPSETIALLPSFRFNFGDFDVRMCRVFVWPRLILPVPVLLKRLAAPEWVFNLGIFLLVFLIFGGVQRSPPGQTEVSPVFSGLSEYTGSAVAGQFQVFSLTPVEQPAFA
jgi:hypothetical protein